MTRKRRTQQVHKATQPKDDDSQGLVAALTRGLVPQNTISLLLSRSTLADNGLSPSDAYDLIRSGIALSTVLDMKRGSPGPISSEAPEEETGHHGLFQGLTDPWTNLLRPFMPALSLADRRAVTTWAKRNPLGFSHGYACAQFVQPKGRPVHALLALLHTTKGQLDEISVLMERTPISLEGAVQVVKGGHIDRVRRLGKECPEIWPVVEKFLSAPPRDIATFRTLLRSGFPVSTAAYVIHTCPVFLAYAVYFREKVPRETLDLMVSLQFTRTQLLALDSLLLCPILAEDPHLCVRIVSHRAHRIENVRSLAMRGEITTETPLEEILKLVAY